MSENKEKQAAPAKGGGINVVAMVLPAVLAAGAAFGGAKMASAHHEAAPAAAAQAEAVKPPGPTLALDPFLLSVTDVNKKVHPMKVTIAIEFDAKDKAGEEGLKGLTPRVRDATFGYLRTLPYEEAVDASGGAKMRAELLERLRSSGAPAAEHVLITDLVIQ